MVANGYLNANITITNTMQIDLECDGSLGNRVPFRVELQTHALEALIADAIEAYRVYEMMMIRRPGDVWKYLWVKAVEVPDSVTKQMARRRKEAYPYADCPWPDACLPLTEFDKFFYWGWDDTSRESFCWLTERGGLRFKEIGDELFGRMRQAQAWLRNSSDLLIKSELAFVDTSAHPYDYHAYPQFMITQPDYTSPTKPVRSATYHDKLRELLRRPEVLCVAVRGDRDYASLKIVCAEQLRRAMISGNPVGHDLPLSVLSDHFPSFDGWGSKALLYSEGLMYGDLFVNESGHTPLKNLMEMRLFRRRLALSHQDEGEIEGFQRTVGEGWFLYEDHQTGFDYTAISERTRLEFICRLSE